MKRSLAFAAVLLCSALPAEAAAAETATDFPIWIELDKPQRVTVVIEDAAGAESGRGNAIASRAESAELGWI